MRLFTLEPETEGNSPIGSSAFRDRAASSSVRNRFLEFGTWVYVPGGIRHNFDNAGDGLLLCLCIVPPKGDVNPFNGC